MAIKVDMDNPVADRARAVDGCRQGTEIAPRTIGHTVIGSHDFAKITPSNSVAESLTGRIERGAKDQPIESVFAIAEHVTSAAVGRPDLRVIDPSFDNGQRTLLLVDDNDDNRRAVSLLLQFSGFNVRTAANTSEAYAALCRERFDLLISDINLPDGSGLDIMRFSRDRLGLKGIAYSGYGGPDDVRESLLAGFSHHVLKPTSFDNLISLIRSI